MAVVPRDHTFQASPHVEAVLSFFSNASLDVDISGLTLRQLMNCVGKHCEQLSKSCTTLKHIILKLRNMSVTLEKADDLDFAIQWISEGYEEPPAKKVVKQYANALKGFLRMPQLMIPENPILTGTLPKWMFKGDEVDVFYQETESVGVWWHAVIIDDLPRSAKSCCVYWVGWEPCVIGNKSKSRRPGNLYLNPTYVNRDDVRSHIPGKCSAGSLASHSVARIRSTYCVVHIDEEESATKDQEQDLGQSEFDTGGSSSGQGQEVDTGSNPEADDDEEEDDSDDDDDDDEEEEEEEDVLTNQGCRRSARTSNVQPERNDLSKSPRPSTGQPSRRPERKESSKSPRPNRSKSSKSSKKEPIQKQAPMSA
jgi:hypothetical protein